MEIEKKTTFMYKCKMCGKVFSAGDTISKEPHQLLINSIYKIAGTLSVPMQTSHTCINSTCGVADLIGCITE